MNKKNSKLIYVVKPKLKGEEWNLVILVGIRFYFTTFLMIVAISIIYNEFVRKPDLETKLSDSEKKI